METKHDMKIYQKKTKIKSPEDGKYTLIPKKKQQQLNGQWTKK